jgi:maltose O-acetyltransferase
MKKLLISIGKIIYFLEAKKKSLIHLYLQEKYYSRAKKIGKCVQFNGQSYIGSIEKVEIGDNVHIGDNAYISAKGGLFIGDNTHISRNLLLYTDSHNYKGTVLPYDDTFILKKVTIEKNVWIGMNVTILPGTYIEEGAVIGAGSVVSGRVKKYSIIGASLAKEFNKRDKNHYDKLENEKQYGGKNGQKIQKDCM